MERTAITSFHKVFLYFILYFLVLFGAISPRNEVRMIARGSGMSEADCGFGISPSGTTLRPQPHVGSSWGKIIYIIVSTIETNDISR